MADLLLADLRNHVLVMLVHNPPVNALGAEVAGALADALDRAVGHSDVRAIVIGATGRTFVAGADIAKLEEAAWGDPQAAINLHPLLTRVEACPKPVVVAMHGTALGAGLELAMAAHYRVALGSAVLGLPEVNLGVIPGGEGTQRLPRLVGVKRALDMCVTGTPLSAADALAAGLVDRVVDDNLVGSAVAWAERIVESGAAPPRTSGRIDRLGTPAENRGLLESARAIAAQLRAHQSAPLRAIDAIEAATTLSFEEGCRRERDLFLDCVASDQAKAMMHVFFAERGAARVPDVPSDLAVPAVQRVAVVGAGAVGAGIAMACAEAGLDVRISDVDRDALERGLTGIRRHFELSLARGRLTAAQMDERMTRIHAQDDYADFHTAEIIIEAAPDSLPLKQRIFGEIDGLAGPDCLLGTSTSTLDVDAIARATRRPGLLVGLHFASPSNVMRLVEIIRGRETSPRAVAAALALARRLKKVGVVVRNGPGCAGNRMMAAYRHEAQWLVDEGATPPQVDRALTAFGMTTGIFAVEAVAAIDAAWRDRRQTRTPGRVITDDEIVERSVYALINEGARLLDEAVALRAADLDVISVAGYGFPLWRGGPLMYADLVGLGRVHERVSSFHREFGDRWKPAPLLARLAGTNRAFRDYDRSRRNC
jgi:3-hydroxyacyl-CoA dehydrogenase